MSADLFSEQQMMGQMSPMPMQRMDYYASPYMSKHIPSLIKWEIDMKDVLMEVKHDIVGKSFEVGENDTIDLVQTQDPLMSEFGATRVLGFSKMDFSKTTVLSYYEKEEFDRAVSEFE